MPLISKVTLRNYKSIANCRVDLQALTFLVGPNGSGKSNFLDGLRFTSDALRTSLDHALRDRGTIKEVRRRSGGHPNRFAIRIDFTLPTGEVGHYSFRVGEKPSGGFEVLNEECKVASAGGGLAGISGGLRCAFKDEFLQSQSAGNISDAETRCGRTALPGGVEQCERFCQIIRTNKRRDR
jgi:hypothetical protein